MISAFNRQRRCHNNPTKRPKAQQNRMGAQENRGTGEQGNSGTGELGNRKQFFGGFFVFSKSKRQNASSEQGNRKQFFWGFFFFSQKANGESLIRIGE
jgi:hypothetical protein